MSLCLAPGERKRKVVHLLTIACARHGGVVFGDYIARGDILAGASLFVVDRYWQTRFISIVLFHFALVKKGGARI